MNTVAQIRAWAKAKERAKAILAKPIPRAVPNGPSPTALNMRLRLQNDIRARLPGRIGWDCSFLPASHDGQGGTSVAMLVGCQNSMILRVDANGVLRANGVAITLPEAICRVR